MNIPVSLSHTNNRGRPLNDFRMLSIKQVIIVVLKLKGWLNFCSHVYIHMQVHINSHLLMTRSPYFWLILMSSIFKIVHISKSFKRSLQTVCYKNEFSSAMGICLYNINPWPLIALRQACLKKNTYIEVLIVIK